MINGFAASQERIDVLLDVRLAEHRRPAVNRLITESGEPSQCGWLKDRFGVSWQVIPKALGRYLSDKDRARAERTMQAMLKMKKIVIADLDKAHAG